MKLYINRFPVNGPWGGGNSFVRAFHQYAPGMGAELVKPESFANAPDVILVAGLDNDGYGISAEQAIMYKAMMEGKKDVKLVMRVNENDARKGTSNVDAALLKLMSHMDGVVFVSTWLRDYFVELGWKGQNDAVIINGVDKDIFKPQPKLNNGKLNIVAHHWSDNRMKGADTYEKIDELVGKAPDKFSFTYIGRHKCNFKHTTVVRPLFGKKLGEELGKYDVYVSASVADPGPNHILEALACELLTYVHKDGGGCVEFAGSGRVYNDWEELNEFLHMAHFFMGPDGVRTGHGRHVTLNDWPACVQEYISFLETTCKRQ